MAKYIKIKGKVYREVDIQISFLGRALKEVVRSYQKKYQIIKSLEKSVRSVSQFSSTLTPRIANRARQMMADYDKLLKMGEKASTSLSSEIKRMMKDEYIYHYQRDKESAEEYRTKGYV